MRDFALLSRGSLQSILHGVSVFKTQPRRDISYAKMSARSGETMERHSIYRHRDVVAFVLSALLRRSRPSAIRRLIISVWIKPVDRVLRCRFSSHVSEEILKRVSPPVANLNTSASPPRIVLVPSAIAAFLHLQPGHILRRFAASRLSMSGAHSRQLFFSEASARVRASATKIGSGHTFGASAIALAKPKSTVLFCQNNQSSKALPTEIHHRIAHISRRGIVPSRRDIHHYIDKGSATFALTGYRIDR